jgi:hypothetical protein
VAAGDPNDVRAGWMRGPGTTPSSIACLSATSANAGEPAVRTS